MVANQSYQHDPIGHQTARSIIGTVTKSIIIPGASESPVCDEDLTTGSVLATGMPKRLGLDMLLRALPSFFSDRGWTNNTRQHNG
jgi:hypothetical protein